jgi:hypothetical protein
MAPADYLPLWLAVVGALSRGWSRPSSRRARPGSRVSRRLRRVFNTVLTLAAARSTAVPARWLREELGRCRAAIRVVVDGSKRPTLIYRMKNLGIERSSREP